MQRSIFFFHLPPLDPFPPNASVQPAFSFRSSRISSTATEFYPCLSLEPPSPDMPTNCLTILTRITPPLISFFLVDDTVPFDFLFCTIHGPCRAFAGLRTVILAIGLSSCGLVSSISSYLPVQTAGLPPRRAPHGHMQRIFFGTALFGPPPFVQCILDRFTSSALTPASLLGDLQGELFPV